MAKKSKRTRATIKVIKADGTEGPEADLDDVERAMGVMAEGLQERRAVKGPDGSDQHLMDGMGPLVDPQLDPLVHDAAEARKVLAAAKAQKDTADDALVAAMRARRISVYETDGIVVVFEAREKLTVKDTTENE